MTTIFDTIISVFNNNSLTEFKRRRLSLKKFITVSDKKFTEIIKLLINNYLGDNKFLAFQLLDSVVCKDTAIYLSDTLQKQLSTIDFKDTEILYEKKKYKCDSYNSCEQLMRDIKFKTKSGEITNKKEICDKIATFNIRIMNLVAALLVQLDPINNIAIQRMNILYNSINDDEIQISLCNQKEKQLLDEYGLHELINLYLYNLLLFESNERISLVEEYNRLVNIFRANLAKEAQPVIVDDIRVATSTIKKKLTQFHDKFRTKQHIKTTDNTKENKKTVMKPPNQENTMRNIKLDEQTAKLTEQQQKLNTQTTRITEQEYKIQEQARIIEEQKSTMEELKEEISKVFEELKTINSTRETEVKELERKLNEVNMKYAELEKQQKASNNYEVLELKKEILQLMNNVKGQRKTMIKGGELNDTVKRFKDFMSKFSVIGETKELQNKFFTMFNSSLKLPTSVKNICSVAKLDESKMIKINFTTTDKEINSYLQIYNDMSNYYINRIKDMIRILEDEILEIKYNTAKEVISVNIRKITEEQLTKQEIRIRILLAEYINKIHEYYLTGISELNNFLSRQ
jgi:hypothetical protein